MRVLAGALVTLAAVLGSWSAAPAMVFREAPALEDRVTAGVLPPVESRLPEEPYVDPMDRPWQSIGRHGGSLRILMSGTRDLRQMTVYGYARLVGYNSDLELLPDILAEVKVRRGASSPSACARDTSGRTANPSPPRTSATGGRTWRTTKTCRP